jgi:hypothetical protein
MAKKQHRFNYSLLVLKVEVGGKGGEVGDGIGRKRYIKQSRE